MRICFVTSHPPSRGRLSEYAVKVLRELEKSPRIKRIYVLSDSYCIDPSYDAKVKVTKVWEPDNLASIVKILFTVLSLQPDVVHFNAHFQSFGRGRLTNFVGLSLAFMCRVLGIRSVVSIHNLGEKVNLNAVGVRVSLLNRLGIRLVTMLITSASRVTVTVRSYAEYLERTYGSRNVEYVPHGTDLVNLPSLPPTNPCRVILMFGHMSPYKGLPTMLEIFSLLVHDREDLKLIVAGDSHPNFPGYLDHFVKNPSANVEFVGYVDEQDLRELFHRAFVVVLPYVTATGTSGVFHLACGFGKPIVASDLPEMKELVDQGASAILVSPGDVEGFRKAILRLCDEPSLVEEMRERNLMFASKETWTLVASSFERIYRDPALK